VRILLVGGTSFVGRAIALAGLARDHEVTVLNRGVTQSDLPDTVTRLVGDRRGDLGALAGRSFDATVDVIAYWPGDVAFLHEALGDRGGHHLQISSVSAYEDPPHAGATEEAATVWPDGGVDPTAPITEQTYGPLKAACEREARARFGDGITIVRPTYVIGAHDMTLRFPYWVARGRRGGTIAVPGPHDAAMQYLDARDLGAFVITLLEQGTVGSFTAAGPWPEARFVTTIEAVARHVGPPGTSVVEVDPKDVERHGLQDSFPLWGGHASQTALAMDPSAALTAGLTYRKFAASIDDVVEWWADRPWPESWLSSEDEQVLLASTATSA
jgi:2'-hydroxyisoflavone reductase